MWSEINKTQNMNQINKVIFLSIIFLFSIFNAQSQQFTYDENNDKEGLKLLSSSNESMNLSFGVHQFSIEEIELNGENMQKLVFGLPLIPGATGSPDMPFYSRSLLIPDGAEAKLVITSADNELYQNINIVPAAEIPFETKEAAPAVKGVQYQINEMYPALPVEMKQTEIRGMQFLQLAVSPFQYNPVTKELLVHKNINIEIQLTNSKGTYGEDRFRSPFWDQILSDLAFNAEDIPKIDYSKRNTNSKDLGCEYLIVVPDNLDFMAWADTIKNFRNEQGIHTKVMTVSEIGGNTIQSINNFFEDVYETWDPVPSAVLLMADYGEDDNGITSIRYTHPYEGTFITDNYYADVTNNILPDFVFARMTGRSYDEFELLVNKFINYERNPPTLETFYANPITALGWQTERWFQICSETIGGYMRNELGKTPTRINAIYDGNPSVDPWSTASNTNSVLNYFGVSGLNYLPATPSELGDWEGGTANDVINAINTGAFILQHRDHGYYGGWGEPSFGSGNISQLNNENLLTHVFTINCQTGQFDVDPACFAERFHRYENGGALSLTAPTQVSYSFVNDAFTWGMYDNMWPDFMPDYGNDFVPERDFRPAFGCASGKYFLSNTNWTGNGSKVITYRLFHHHGDAFNIVYTEVPMENTISYDPGISSDITEIIVQAEDGSLVGLSINSELLAFGFVEDGSVALDIPAQDPGTIIKVVVTKQNYYRHEGDIMVIPAEGAYIMQFDYTVHDENDNGLIEYNEEIILDFSVKNVGPDLAENVIISLSTNDEFIDLTLAEQNIGNIASDEEISIEQAFTFNTSVNIPDLHKIDFIFSATDGTSVWESDLSFTAYAPNLIFTVIQFEETDGNGNGYLDPGETASASYEVKNTGHVDFPAGISSLSANSGYIEINSSSQDFDALGMNETMSTEFEITTSSDTPPYSIASITNQLDAGPFSIEKDLFFNIGLIVEDWETENFEKFNWTFSGEYDWEIVDNYVAEGDFSAKSAAIGDGESSVIELGYNLIADHEISFYMQVSCQEDHDFLNFYIDDQLIQSWTGLVLFEQFSFPVTEGEHIFKWEYIKDEDGDSGLDAAWIDFIILPPGNILIGTEELNQSTALSLGKVYPNPAKDILYIESGIDQNIIEYEILSAFGQLIDVGYMDRNQSVDISNYLSGIYIVRLKNDNGYQQTVSFIKM